MSVTDGPLRRLYEEARPHYQNLHKAGALRRSRQPGDPPQTDPAFAQRLHALEKDAEGRLIVIRGNLAGFSDPAATKLYDAITDVVNAVEDWHQVLDATQPPPPGLLPRYDAWCALNQAVSVLGQTITAGLD